MKRMQRGDYASGGVLSSRKPGGRPAPVDEQCAAGWRVRPAGSAGARWRRTRPTGAGPGKSHACSVGGGGPEPRHGSPRRRAATAAGGREWLAELRYRNGITIFVEVLLAQQQTFETELQLSQANRGVYESVVNLYTALGGGWQPDGQTAAKR